LELVAVEPAGEVLFAEDVGDRFAVAVAGAEAPVARSSVTVVACVVVWHVDPFGSGGDVAS
jgi:hypothetical protein